VACHPSPEDPGWGQPSVANKLLYPEYKRVIDAVGDRCGFADPSEQPQRDTLNLIVNKWREMFPGRCVTGPQDWNNSGDSVSVGDPQQSGVWIEIHAVYFGNGCIITTENAIKNAWPCPGCELVIPTGVQPTPPPTPPPVNGCSDPVTPTVNRFNLKPHNRWYDSTPLFYGKEYCTAIGFPDRLFCPARSECPGYKCEERVACEQVGIGGPAPKFHCEVGEPQINPENAFQARCGDGTWIEVCAADGVTACNRVNF
jgi:hypothetical protein